VTDDRALLRDTAAAVFSAWAARGAAELPDDWDEALWLELEELGFTLVGISEEAGGSGGDLAASLDVVRAASFVGAPIPVATSALIAAWLLAEAGREIPTGVLAFLVIDKDMCPTVAADAVAFGRHARHIVVAKASAGSVLDLACVDRSVCAVEPGEDIAGEPSDRVEFPPSSLDFVSTSIPVAALQARFAIVSCAVISGLLDGALASSVTYATQRAQFGRPISRFQSVQAMLAELAGYASAARVATETAIALYASPSWELASFSAAAYAAEAAGPAAALAHQIHGAIGFTDEHPLGRLTRRLWAWRDVWGNERMWAERLGDQLMTPDTRLWDALATASGP
jgi:acyl-CoA dehydrogenase